VRVSWDEKKRQAVLKARNIDDEDCKKMGITRQSWIKTVCREKLLEIHKIMQ
jgi:hypothetical protein